MSLTSAVGSSVEFDVPRTVSGSRSRHDGAPLLPTCRWHVARGGRPERERRPRGVRPGWALQSGRGCLGGRGNAPAGGRQARPDLSPAKSGGPGGGGAPGWATEGSEQRLRGKAGAAGLVDGQVRRDWWWRWSRAIGGGGRGRRLRAGVRRDALSGAPVAAVVTGGWRECAGRRIPAFAGMTGSRMAG